MNRFNSSLQEVGMLEFPPFTDIRIMMMPIRLDDLDSTIPDFLAIWRNGIKKLEALAPCHKGVAYLTIDEMTVKAGRTHRRPGIHVDGIGPDGNRGPWGGNWGMNGMLQASTHVGCQAWMQNFEGFPMRNGDCSNLAEQCNPRFAYNLQPDTVYLLSGLTVHKALSLAQTVKRQFVRLSMPSDAPWYEGYTPNPTGLLPEGPIHPPRPVEFMLGIK